MAEGKMEVKVKFTKDKSELENMGKDIGKGISKALGSVGLGGISSGVSNISAGISAGAKAGAGAEAGGASSGMAAGVAAGLIAAGVVAVLGEIASILKMWEPIMKIFKLILFLLFLPLLPFFLIFVKKMIELAKVLVPIMDKIRAFVDKSSGGDLMTAFVLGLAAVAVMLVEAILILISQEILRQLTNLWTALQEGWKQLGQLWTWLKENVLAPGFEKLKRIGDWLWEQITKGFTAIKDLGPKIWELVKKFFQGKIDLIKDVWAYIKTFFSGILDVVNIVWGWIKTFFSGSINAVSVVWDFIKGLFKGTINVAKDVLKWFEGLFGGGSSKKAGDFVVTPNGVIQTDPADFVIGTKNPSGLGGGGNYTVNINNPQVRSEQDIKSLVRQIERYLQTGLRRRTSYT